ncbi:hypothetical protein CEP51_001388 [Fusarium floridanum]|uniref:tRNA-intron lyase n=1 Tax=Fusarium floridanum TaxID=1325733 RepID=A0A428SGY0_9HYPO|nr:hypothetical protein CEP51_001388 [Fusarium floridanum]
MAEIQSSTKDPVGTPPTSDPAAPQQSQKRGPSLHQIYALPAPIRTFPLPTFYPNNPVSFFHVAYAWLGQLWSPPPAEPAAVHLGVWSPATSSVHITDEVSTRALWEQGFYGKGSLSRSEPNWLKREKVRQGLADAHVSEIMTVQRREERMRAKWERARLEQEAIRQTRLEEAQEAETRKVKAREAKERESRADEPTEIAQPKAIKPISISTLPVYASPVSPGALLALPNSPAELALATAAASSDSLANGNAINGEALFPDEHSSTNGSNGAATNGKISIDTRVSNTSPSNESDDSKPLKRRKSVRFSPNVESTTFRLGDPPSPQHAAANAKQNGLADVDAAASVSLNGNATTAEEASASGNERVIKNMEHLQLMPEEAFFLSFGLGALTVNDPTSGSRLSSMELLRLFRQYSYFPPRVEPEDPALQPDDNFLVHYAVYHHFRSLGWVPRGGIKFGVDWLLYTRGPVFDHAEFGLIVIPSYSDPQWKESGKQNPRKSWQWLHGTVRVLSHVTKSLVLVYVDVPPPSKFEEALDKGIAEAFKMYKVREVMVKRWSSNRNR